MGAGHGDVAPVRHRGPHADGQPGGLRARPLDLRRRARRLHRQAATNRISLTSVPPITDPPAAEDPGARPRPVRAAGAGLLLLGR